MIFGMLGSLYLPEINGLSWKIKKLLWNPRFVSTIETNLSLRAGLVLKLVCAGNLWDILR